MAVKTTPLSLSGRVFLSALACVACLAVVMPAQTGLGVRGDREATWFAPTEADWAKPVQITWQRSWESAVELSLETNRPILVCINMDGEIASEHYAGVRYRQPEIAALYEPYVNVIASVYRHTPRDWDEQGVRIPCPRFGGVTCGEHIAIEPKLYELFMDETRIAPRHIMIELDGSETYDVMLAWDTKSVFGKVEQGIVTRDIPMQLDRRTDRPLAELVASPDVRDQLEVEALYRSGGRTIQRAIVDAAVAQGPDAPMDILRLAVYGIDTEMMTIARGALMQSARPEAADLIVKALETPMTPVERNALLAALDRLGEDSSRVRTIAVVQRGLSDAEGAIDVEGWAGALDGGATYAPRVNRALVEARLTGQNEVLDSEDAEAHLELAESFLEQAYEQFRTDRRFAELLFQDALNTVRSAESLGVEGWRVDAAVAIASYYLDDRQTAYARAEAAVADGSVDDAPGWNAMAVLAIFAQGRQQAIHDAVTAKTDWPPQWLADVDAAYEVLARHPHGTDEQIVAHYDFLNWLGAGRASGRVLQQGLERFPSSWDLHDRMRTRILWRFGVNRLESVYEDMLNRPEASPDLRWFAGHASLAAAEVHRKEGRGSRARDAYANAIAHFELDLASTPDATREDRDATDHQVAVAHGGLARIALEQDDLEGAVTELVASFERSPGSAATLDGLNISPADTARMVYAKLITGRRAKLAARLDAALKQLDAGLLDLPAYEKIVMPDAPDDA
jgi:hypothetical protein